MDNTVFCLAIKWTVLRHIFQILPDVAAEQQIHIIHRRIVHQPIQFAYWAAKGSLRENGKLIILLDVEDLIKMNLMRIEQDDPADFLLSKLDDLLLDLEK